MKYFPLIFMVIIQFYISMVSAGQWSKPIVVMETPVVCPQIEMDNRDNLHLIFPQKDPKVSEKDSTSPATDIFHTFFDGVSWAPSSNISNSNRVLVTPVAIHPKLLVDRINRLHVTWGEGIVIPERHNRAHVDELLYSYYDNNKWSEPLTFYYNDDLSRFSLDISNFAVSNENEIHHIWTDIPWINYTYLKNGTVSRIQKIKSGSSPDIYIDNHNKINVAYISTAKIYGHNRNDVFYCYHSHPDSSWSDSVMVYHNPNHYSFYPRIAVDANRRIHIVWQEDEDLNVWPDDIYHSYSDDGLNWSEVYEISPPGGDCYSFDIAIDSKGYLHVVWDQVNEMFKIGVDHVWYAFFNGESWSEKQRITPERKRMGCLPSIAVDSQDYLHLVWVGKIYEGGDYELLYSTTRPTTKVSAQEELTSISDFHLFQNYPNPFNATTNIVFSIPYSTEVSLTIFDLNGRCVKKLLVENTMSQGTYKVQWDGTDETGKRIASGVYLYRLKAQNFTENKKMILLF